MSLTLPYPDLDFVPLDVLTAEEMNQVVSNYTYISDQFPLANDNIGQAAVKSQNIDWTTMSIQTSGNKNCIKFENGLMIFWRKFGVSGTIDTAFGSIFVKPIESVIDLFVDDNNKFIEPPTVTITVHGNNQNGGSAWLSTWTNNSITATAIPANHLALTRPNQQIVNVDLHIFAIGRWK